MVGIRRSLKISLMALITIRIRELIVAVGMARLAVRERMFSSQRELCRVVVERGRRPGVCVMTESACLRKSQGLVVRVYGRGKVAPMTIDAIHRKRCELVVDVTIVAGNRPVSAGQRKSRVIVRKRCRLPSRRRMARLTLRGESCCNMVRGRGRCELHGMAHVAVLPGGFEH